MLKKLALACFTLLMLVLGSAISPRLAFAELTNPAVQGDLGSNAEAAQSGATFTNYLVTVWRAVIFIGGLLVILYFLWGGIEWIVAGGDKGKVDKARDKMTQSVMGLVILVSSFTIIGFISATFFGNQFNILNPIIPTPDVTSSGSTTKDKSAPTVKTPGTGAAFSGNKTP